MIHADKIPESILIKILEGKELSKGTNKIIENVEEFKYPLKIVITFYPLKKVYYDDEVDILYLKLGDGPPEGVIELSEEVNLDTTSEDKIVGIEILDAFKNRFKNSTILHIISR